MKKTAALTLLTGLLLIILGTAGIILPGIMSLTTTLFLGWVLVIGGLLWGYHTFKQEKRPFLEWLKAVLLILTGGLLLFYPISGIAAVGLMLSFYLFLDAFASFGLAHSLHPAKGWGWMTTNGVLSLLLAVLFLIGWPASSLWLVGLYVGISLVFDGWVLLVMGFAMRKNQKSLEGEAHG